MIPRVSLSSVAVLVLPLVARAHIALWDEAMFGWNDDPNQAEPGYPLADLSFDDWWLHGRDFRNTPPKAGVFMELPSGGVYHGYTSCNKQQSKYGTIASERDATIYACKSSTSNPADGKGALHTSDTWADPKPHDVKGTSLAIAYESDINKVTPDQFAIFSVNETSPWFQQTDYHIPELPACPDGGCLCMWSWVHSVDGGSEQIYQLAYRCKVTGASETRSLPAPQIAKKCHYPTDTSNCTVGPKQPHYWLQKERNNNLQGYYDPPFYNGDYGFKDGAQTDLFANVAAAVPQTVSSAADSAVTSVVSSVASSSAAEETPSTTSEAIATSDQPSTDTSTTSAAVASTTSALSNSSHVAPTITATSFLARVTGSTATAAASTTGTTLTGASSSKSAGKTCRRVRRSGTLRRRRGVSNTAAAPNKRRVDRPAIPAMRVGTVLSPSTEAEPSRDFAPTRRPALEAVGQEKMQLAREIRVAQLRGGRSVPF